MSDRVEDFDSTDSHRRILERRRDLLGASQRLEASLARASSLADWRRVAEQSIMELQEVWERHVADVEAPDGLFAQVATHAPRLIPAIDDMRGEHRTILEQCDRLLGEMTYGVDADVLRANALDLVKAISVHRQSGSELLYDAYFLDIGTGD